MRRAIFLVVSLLMGSPLLAQSPEQQATALPYSPVPSLADVEALQQRLLASQQVITTLQRQLEEARNGAAALGECRMRNGRLVSISRQLIEGYARRYGVMHRHDPLQLGRRRFEFELQALSDAIYDNKVDVPLRSLPGGEAVTDKLVAEKPTTDKPVTDQPAAAKSEQGK